MASNAKLIEEVEKIASKLGLDINTEGLTNKKLTQLVKDLRAKETDAETETEADTAEVVETEETIPQEATPQTEQQEEKMTSVSKYFVAPGKAITSRKGVLAPGQEVKPSYLSRGLEDISALLKSGHIKVK